jgi:hypothetical protein
MANRRVYYATYRVGIAPYGDPTLASVQGLQSVTMNTTFNLEQAFEIGQQALYENIEGIPAIECSMEKVLDGACPIYLLATQDATDTGGAGLGNRSSARCMVGMEIYADTVSSVGYGGATAISAVQMSGMYVSSVSYTVPVDGNATESVTLVGNDKSWHNGDWFTFTDNPFSTNTDSPIAITGSGGVNRRENILLGATGSVFPTQLPGVTDGGGGSGHILLVGDEWGAHLQNVSVSTDMGREELFELGRRGPYYRFVNFPVEVTTEYTMTSSSGDMINAVEDVTAGSCDATANLVDSVIILKMCEGLVVDCGTKNKLSSANITGGDATGGNQEITYSYTNFNDFAVYHPQDPQAGNASFVYSGG